MAELGSTGANGNRENKEGVRTFIDQIREKISNICFKNFVEIPST